MRLLLILIGCLMASTANGLPTPILANFDPTCPVPLCAGLNIELLFPVSNDPTKFWQCIFSRSGGMEPVQMDCQCGTYFYWDKQRCEFPWDTPQLCTETLELEKVPPPRSCEGVTVPTVPPFNPACPKPICIASEMELLFPYNDDPRKFIQCASFNNPVTLNCQCGTYFNFVNQRCDFPFEIKEFCTSVRDNPPPPVPCEEWSPTVPLTTTLSTNILQNLPAS